jgi:hypothetical protein
VTIASCETMINIAFMGDFLVWDVSHNPSANYQPKFRTRPDWGQNT